VTTRRRGYARATNAEPVARVGDVLVGRFRLQRIIGRGGMGVVFAASDLQMQGEPQIAIKLLNEDMRDFPVAAMALERECRKVRMLALDSIVRVFEFYRSGDLTFITMELLEGDSLDARIKQYPRGMPRDEAWHIIRAAAEALSYAHRQKPPFVHSDFKPSNVFVTKSGQVKVLDFGVARAANIAGAPTANNLSIFDPAQYGALTPAYASCEMLAGLDADTRDDIYSLACVAYEMLAGEHPFARRSADQARSMRLKPAPIPSLGARVNRALAHGLAADRVDRTASVAQFIQELGEPPQPPEVRERRLGFLTRLGAYAAAVIVLGLGLWRLIPLVHLPKAASPSPETPSSQTSIQGSVQAPTPAPPAPTPSVRTLDMVAGNRAADMAQLLGIPVAGIDTTAPVPIAQLRQLIGTSPRRVVLGSTPEQIQAALGLCRQYSSACQASWYADEKLHTVTLAPFELDVTPTSVRDFRRFADSTQYETEAEAAGFAYSLVGQSLQQVSGGNWRNAIKQHPVTEESPVVGVSYRDAQSFCRWKKERLPTEDEWEYVARGPERRNFPSGDNVSLSTRPSAIPPRAGDGPAEGIGGHYRGLSGNVWQWVDTTAADGSRILKGGSWLETNPANRRAAVQRMEQPSRADVDSGFRCARTLSSWPDTELWLSRIK